MTVISLIDNFSEHTVPKCKVCGSRVEENVAKCPLCGSLVNAGSPVVTMNNNNPKKDFHNQPSASQSQIPTYSNGTNSNMPKPYVPPAKPVQQHVPSGRDATDDELEDAYITGSVRKPFRSSAYIHYKTAFGKFENGEEVAFTYRYGTMINLPYRKHYVRGFFLGLFFWILWIPFFMTKNKRNKMIYGTGVGVTLTVPMINNDWYVFNRYKKIAYRALRKFPGDSDRQLLYVAKKGGTNFFAAFIFVIFISIPLFVLIYIGYFIYENGLY